MKLGYSSDNRQDCTHCRFYLKDTPFQNDNAKLLLFRELARGWMIFLFLPRLQQPCHACIGLCDGGHLWLRHLGICPSYYENPTLHIGVN
jgi:hypothetical protein